MTFAELVAQELATAREHHEPWHSPHQAYALILEELDEFWEQVRLKRTLRSQDKMLQELVQIASCAQRAAEDLGLLDTANGL